MSRWTILSVDGVSYHCPYHARRKQKHKTFKGLKFCLQNLGKSEIDE